MKMFISVLSLLVSISLWSTGAIAAQGNCDNIDQAPERMRAKLEKMCKGRLERKAKAEDKAEKRMQWSKAYFNGGSKRSAVFDIYKKHGSWLWPCKDYVTNCEIWDLQMTKGVGNEIYKQDDNVVFRFKDATKGNPIVTCHIYVVDKSGEKLISRESKICDTY